MLFTEACKEHVRKYLSVTDLTNSFYKGTIKKDEPNDPSKKSQNTFVLKVAIDKQLTLLRQEKEDDNNAVPNGLFTFIEGSKY